MRIAMKLGQIDEIIYYFDLSTEEIALILHELLHDLADKRDLRCANIIIEQGQHFYSFGNKKKFTLIIFLSKRLLTSAQIINKINKIPIPIKKR